MSRKWMKFINLALGVIALLILLIIGFLHILSPKGIQISERMKTTRPLPPPQFGYPADVYKTMATTLFKLNFAPPKLELPDLRGILVYYGTNTRPDTDPEKKPLFFSINNSPDRLTAKVHEKIYLMFDRKLKPPAYIFSPENKETPLWFEAETEGEDALIKVGMNDENGRPVTSPADHREFTLKAEEAPRFGNRRNTPWEIGKFRVDATLLARQRARWYGRDLFMEQHGGKEYAEFLGKERVDFMEGEHPYSIYFGPNDVAIWKDDRWQQAKIGEETRGYPLLQVKKIEERLMSLELWDASGQNKITMNLLKSREPWMPKRLEKEFKFIAARTRTQYVFEIKGVRTIIKPQDWLVQTENGWTKLSTVEEIDAYVHRKTIGPLFIFDGPVKTEEGQQVLRAHFYNTSRTEVDTMEIPTQTTSLTILPGNNKEENMQENMQNQESPSDEEELPSGEEEKLFQKVKEIPPRPPKRM